MNAMEEAHYVARARLRTLIQQHPNWTKRRLAEEVGYSVGWVKKWSARLRTAAPDDEQVLHGLSQRRHTSYPRPSPEIVQRILDIRDHPPNGLQRVPGPKAIRYYLHEDPTLRVAGVVLPRSTRTIWRILDEHGRISRPTPVEHTPLERPEPMSSWAMDFKDITTIPAERDGKKQHVVEVLNLVDEGTSIWLDYHLRGDFRAETVIPALALTFEKLGVPDQIRLDRDTRFVGPAGMRDFPAAVQRFLLCLGIQVVICPPHHPDKNPYVERLHGTLERECIQVTRPTDTLQAAHAFEHFHLHYHHDRPHQGTVCKNQPPARAFPSLPQRPSLPVWVDPDRWMWSMKGKYFIRKIRSSGSITIDKFDYYIKKELAGQYVVASVDAVQREFVIAHKHQIIKRIPIKGLQHSLVSFEDYLKFILQQARSEALRSVKQHSKGRLR